MKRAVKFLLEHGAGALFLEPGLCKTSITLAALKLLFKAGVEDKVLVIAPLLVAHNTWPEEIKKWKDFNHFKYVVLHGPDKDELLKEKADIYLINPEGLDWLLQTVKTKHPRTGKTAVALDVARFKRLGFGTLVVDELTRFKNHQADRFKAMKLVLHTFRRRWGLTGSPAANGLLQLFGQMYMLDEGRSLGQYVSHYRSKYFLPAYSGFGWRLQQGAEELIYERLSPLVLRIEAKGLIDMPIMVPNDIKLALPEAAMATYLSLEHTLLAELDQGRVVAKTTGVALGKCRQVASGAVFLTPEVTALLKPRVKKREWAEVHDVKIEALGDLIDELQGQPLLVAYEFNHDLERLRKAFPDAVFVTDYKPRDFGALRDRWNRGEIPVLMAQPSGVSHGLNLQEAGNHVAWFTLTWDGEIYDQFNRRVMRSGNTHEHVFVHHLIAKNTVDEVVLDVLKSKDKGQSALFDGLIRLKKLRKS